MNLIKKNLNCVVYWLLCLILIDSVLLTGGRLFSIGPISYRVLLTALAGILCIPALIKNFRNLIREPIVLFLLSYAIVLTVGVVRAIVLKQDLDVGYIIIMGSLYLLLLPIMLVCVKSKKQVEILLKIITYGGTILSLCIIAISILNIHLNVSVTPIATFMHERNIGMLYMATQLIPRVLIFGSMAQIAACCFCCYFYLKNEGVCWQYLIMTGINLTGILQTYTRGIYFGAFTAMVVLLICMLIRGKSTRIRLGRFFAVSAGVFAALILLLTMINRTAVFSYALFRVSMGTPAKPACQALFEHSQTFLRGGEDSAEIETLKGNTSLDIYRNRLSLNIRQKMKERLAELIAKNPIFGNGMGAHINLRDGKVEMVYHDVVSKLGFLGLVLLFLPLVTALIRFLPLTRKQTVNKQADDHYMLLSVCIAAFFGLLSATYTNPYLFCSLGMFFYCIVLRLSAVKLFPIADMDALGETITQ